MPVVARTLRQHLLIARSYPAAMLIVLATFLLVLYYGHIEHRMLQAVGYLIAVWLGAFVTDLVVNLKPSPAIGFPITHPVSKELGIIFACLLLETILVCIRFYGDWTMHSGLYRLLLIAFLFISMALPILIYLFYLRYKPSQLGANLRYWYLPLLIHILVGCTALTFANRQSHWIYTIRYVGLANAVLAETFGAAVPEEFIRMLLQSRLGSALHSKGLGFVLATLLWAGMHFPISSHGSRALFLQLLPNIWTMMPIGFLWGYLTHRTKSLLPAVLVHGLNFWGLQTF